MIFFVHFFFLDSFSKLILDIFLFKFSLFQKKKKKKCFEKIL